METNGSESDQYTGAKPIQPIDRDDLELDDGIEAYREGYEKGRRIILIAYLRAMKRSGIPHQKIANVMGVSLETIERLS